ncbi:NAD-dependent dehydratase [Corynebacterium poyangense]|uniref:NAD-dependent dehydratase n=1 Tax=Corynebacterium poyangense TaxID=2684405 RepID=A0A7H0SKX6_9CORY|nr:NAD-dependent dehydratase [Corynebacterium poyangense]QNQ89201.1 NAD-dependent dehydratase [Corynebacterium poyangense]
MSNPSVLPGKVAWTGDNPFIYLKEDPAADFTSLSVFFRINASPFGIGQAALVVVRPYDEDGYGIVLTDNDSLTNYLIDEFVSKFVLFRPCSFMDKLEIISDADFKTIREGDDWIEEAHSGDRSIRLIWRDLGTPFAVDVPGPESGTGQHEMFSVFRIAQAGEVFLDGERLPGNTVQRDFLNGPGQSAGMAISETWVEV